MGIKATRAYNPYPLLLNHSCGTTDDSRAPWQHNGERWRTRGSWYFHCLIISCVHWSTRNTWRDWVAISSLVSPFCAIFPFRNLTVQLCCWRRVYSMPFRWRIFMKSLFFSGTLTHFNNVVLLSTFPVVPLGTDVLWLHLSEKELIAVCNEAKFVSKEFIRELFLDSEKKKKKHVRSTLIVPIKNVLHRMRLCVSKHRRDHV